MASNWKRAFSVIGISAAVFLLSLPSSRRPSPSLARSGPRRRTCRPIFALHLEAGTARPDGRGSRPSPPTTSPRTDGKRGRNARAGCPSSRMPLSTTIRVAPIRRFSPSAFQGRTGSTRGIASAAGSRQRVARGCRLTPHCSGLVVSRSRSFLFAAELDIVRRLTARRMSHAEQHSASPLPLSGSTRASQHASWCLALAVCPLALFSLLQFLGLFPGANGLGFGLLFAFGAPIALAVIAIGAVLDSRAS